MKPLGHNIAELIKGEFSRYRIANLFKDLPITSRRSALNSDAAFRLSEQIRFNLKKEIQN